MPSAKPSPFSGPGRGEASAHPERRPHPRRSKSAPRAPEKGFQASVPVFIPPQFKYWIGKSRAALAKHPNANQPVRELEINPPLDKGRGRPAPYTTEQHFVPPTKKIEPLLSEPHPCRRGAGQGIGEEEEGESSAGREECFASPPRLGFLLRIPPVPPGTAREPCPAQLLPRRPPGMRGCSEQLCRPTSPPPQGPERAAQRWAAAGGEDRGGLGDERGTSRSGAAFPGDAGQGCPASAGATLML